MAEKIGVDHIEKTALSLGLGAKTSIDINGENSGFVPSNKWKKLYKNESWYLGDTLNMAIGQGFLLSTPIQLCQLIAIIANKGKLPRLSCAKDTNYNIFNSSSIQTAQYQERLLKSNQMRNFINLSSDNWDILHYCLQQVVSSPCGTAQSCQTGNPDFAIAGKTATSQVRNISKQERMDGIRKNKDIDWEIRDHALFVAFAPYHKPRFATCVVLEHGGSSKTVTKITAKILKSLQKSTILT